MYSHMAEHYEQLFPVGTAKVGFVGKHLPARSHVVDVGCATGELARLLATSGHTVLGLDPDDRMIDRANSLAAAEGLKAVFVKGGFKDVDSAVGPVRPDAVICMGNTLVHAENAEAVADFISHCHQVMKDGGRLIIQTVNMDNLEHLLQTGFPVREGRGVRLERRYQHHESPGRVWFETTITETVSGRMRTGRVPLLVLKRDELAGLLAGAGFEEVEWFGDFNETQWAATSPATIAVATKERSA